MPLKFLTGPPFLPLTVADVFAAPGCAALRHAAALYKADGNVHSAEVPHSKLSPVQDIKVYGGWRFNFAYS